MTILRSPSGSWVNVRDGHKVRIYLRHGWTVWTWIDLLTLVSESIDKMGDAAGKAGDATRRFVEAMRVHDER